MSDKLIGFRSITRVLRAFESLGHYGGADCQLYGWKIMFQCIIKSAQNNCLFNYEAPGGLLSEQKSSETSQTGHWKRSPFLHTKTMLWQLGHHSSHQKATTNQNLILEPSSGIINNYLMPGVLWQDLHSLTYIHSCSVLMSSLHLTRLLEESQMRISKQKILFSCNFLCSLLTTLHLREMN
jgi:hypothetical protein